MLSPTRILTTLAPTVAVAAVLALPASSSASANCAKPKYPGDGYFTSLKVSGTSCSAGSSLAKAHYSCRVKHGKAGTCSSVDGFRCTEKRNSIPTEIDASVTCKKSRETVLFSYQQNL